MGRTLSQGVAGPSGWQRGILSMEKGEIGTGGRWIGANGDQYSRRNGGENYRRQAPKGRIRVHDNVLEGGKQESGGDSNIVEGWG